MSEALVIDQDTVRRDLGNGRSIYVFSLTYGRARLGIGPSDSYVFDDVW